MQFVALSKSQRRLPGGADVMFDHIERDWSSKNQKGKIFFWPLQTMLMVLCPDILINISLATGKSSEVALKVRGETWAIDHARPVRFVFVCPHARGLY